MIIDREFAMNGHIIRLAVDTTVSGWDVQEQCDSTVVYTEHHADWHRVELAMLRLEREALRHGPAHAAYC
jgi:hypothetical protein